MMVVVAYLSSVSINFSTNYDLYSVQAKICKFAFSACNVKEWKDLSLHA